jgi:NADH dehydrogenase FAD-containing subunit
VEVRTGAIVTRVERGAVWVGDEKIETETIFWAAGNESSGLGRVLGAPLDRAGRVKVNPDLSVPGHPEVFVVGDLAEMHTDDVRVPGVATAAIQSGAHAAVFRLLHQHDQDQEDRNKDQDEGENSEEDAHVKGSEQQSGGSIVNRRFASREPCYSAAIIHREIRR